MRRFLKTTLEVVVTFVLSVTFIGGAILGVAHYESKSKDKPSYQMIHNCKYIGKRWTGNEKISTGRGYHYVYFEFTTTYHCDNGPYYVKSQERITSADIVKGIESGRFNRNILN